MRTWVLRAAAGLLQPWSSLNLVNISKDWIRSCSGLRQLVLTADGRDALVKIQNGEKEKNIFPPEEFESRISRLRTYMQKNEIEASVFTSLHNMIYYTGYLYYTFGRSYACVITHDDVTTLTGLVDNGKPWRRAYGNNLIYTDWTRDNYFRGVQHLLGDVKGKIGIEFDYVSLDKLPKFKSFVPNGEFVDIGDATMRMRMIKSAREHEVARQGARIADLGAEAVVGAIHEGVPEYEVTEHATNVMVREIAKTYPQADIQDVFGWLQSGINSDGAHNPVTTRRIQKGDVMVLNLFPMIQGVYSIIERTLIFDHATDDQLHMWQANIDVYKRGLELVKPGIKCSDIALELNEMLRQKDLLQYKVFGYGHSMGMMCHYYGREAALEFREDVHTVLEPGMMVTMEPMITIPQGKPGAGGYREHDVLILTQDSAENITKFPVGPEHNIIKN